LKEDLSGKNCERCKEFPAQPRRQSVQVAINDKRILLKLKASQAWYDEKAAQLDYLYELTPIVCDVPDDATNSKNRCGVTVEDIADGVMARCGLFN
jgi:hypothetical protein